MKPLIKFQEGITPEEAKALVEKEMPKIKKAIKKVQKKEIIIPMTLEDIFGKPSKKEFYEAVKGSPSKKSLGRKLLEKLSRRRNRGT